MQETRIIDASQTYDQQGQGLPTDLELLGGRVVARLIKSGEKSISVVVDDFAGVTLKPQDMAAHVAMGAQLRL